MVGIHSGLEPPRKPDETLLYREVKASGSGSTPKSTNKRPAEEDIPLGSKRPFQRHSSLMDSAEVEEVIRSSPGRPKRPDFGAKETGPSSDAGEEQEVLRDMLDRHKEEILSRFAQKSKDDLVREALLEKIATLKSQLGLPSSQPLAEATLNKALREKSAKIDELTERDILREGELRKRDALLRARDHELAEAKIDLQGKEQELGAVRMMYVALQDSMANLQALMDDDQPY